MRQFLILVSYAIVGLIASGAQAAPSGWSAGVNAMGGYTTTSNVTQTPFSGQVVDYSENDDLSAGGGLWLAYDLNRWLGAPISMELGSNYRYRHDISIGYAFGGGQPQAKQDVMTWDTMLSALWNIPTGTRYTPYIGGGAGMVYLMSDNQTVYGFSSSSQGEKNDWNPAWQLQAGLTYALSSTMDLRLDYRYIDMGEITSAPSSLDGSIFKADLASHDVRIGAMWKF